MSANNLFSFLDVPPDDLDEGISLEHTTEQNSDRPPTPTSSLKRKAQSPKLRPPEQDGDHLVDIELTTNAVKRARLRSRGPVVLDDFETEAKREITASAGLTGTTTEVGSRLELRHQVGLLFHVNYPSGQCSRFGTKSLYRLATNILHYLSMFHPQNLIGSTSLNWIPSRGFLSMPYNVTRVCSFRLTLVQERLS